MTKSTLAILVLGMLLQSCAAPRTGDWISGYKYVKLSDKLLEGDRILVTSEFKRVGINTISEIEAQSLNREDMKTVLLVNHRIEDGVLWGQKIYIDLGDWNSDNPITSTYGKDGAVFSIGKKSREELLSWAYKSLLDNYGSFNSRAVGTRPKPKSERDYIEIYITNKPNRPYGEIGMISAKSKGDKNELLEYFKRKARSMGGDAVIVSGKGFEENSGIFSKSTEEITEAVVIVYKD